MRVHVLNTTHSLQSRFTAFFMILFGLVFTGVSTFILSQGFRDAKEDERIFVMLIGGVFMLVGLGISIGGVVSLKKAKNRSQQLAQTPDQPWLLEKAWASGRIKDSSVGSALGFIFFALFWNGISWAVTIGVFSDKNADTVARYFVLIFPTVGIFIAVGAIYAIAKWMKFGSSVFEMAEVPGVVGGILGGVIKTKSSVRPREGVQLKLVCIYRKVTGSGKQQRTHEETLWESEQTIEQGSIQASGQHALIPVFFEIPYSCQQTEQLSPREQYLWKLTGKAQLSGVDYGSEFVVPVFKTVNSRPDAGTQSPEASKQDAVDLEDTQALQEAGVSMRATASGAELRFERGRRAFYAIAPMVVGGLMTTGAVLLYLGRDDIPLIFPIFMGVFGLFVELTSLTFLVGKVSLNVDAAGLEFKKTGLTGTKSERIPTTSIHSLVPYSAMTIGNTIFYGFEVKQTGARSLRIPANIKGRTQTDAICRLLRHHLKLSQQST